MFTKQDSGFTLLELMISITILALILGVIFGAMRLGSRSWEVGEKRIDRLQRMRMTYDIISEDIKSVLPANLGRSTMKSICPEGRGCKQKAILFIGESDRIKFVTTNPGLDRSLNTSEYRVVSYYLGQHYGEDEKGVMMEEHAWLFPDFFRFETICDTCEAESYSLPFRQRFCKFPVPSCPCTISSSFGRVFLVEYLTTIDSIKYRQKPHAALRLVCIVMEIRILHLPSS